MAQLSYDDIGEDRDSVLSYADMKYTFIYGL
jgi:hypothetical protein